MLKLLDDEPLDHLPNAEKLHRHVPIHPLDGSKLFFALFDKPKHADLRMFVAKWGPQVLLVMVVAAIVFNIDVFFFVTGPAYATCDLLLGEHCSTFLGVILQGL